MIQFYAPDIESTLTLPESDSGHCVRVLRMKEGDEISVIDGRGTRFSCRLTDAHSKHAKVEIVSSQSIPLPWQSRLTVAVAPTKSLDRMEWLVEKLTEIGINRFIPVLCRHSERKELKVERIEKIAVSAMKQSLKAFKPEILPMTPIDKLLEMTATADGQKFIAYCDDCFERKLLAREIVPSTDMTLLIGPEGDFTSDEVAASINAGYVPVTLGDNRLRTETAALVGADTFHIVNQLNNK